MLLQVKNYLMEKGKANLREIAFHLRQSPETVREILAHWVRKGKVHRCEAPANCGSKCQLCKPEVAEVYQWL